MATKKVKAKGMAASAAGSLTEEQMAKLAETIGDRLAQTRWVVEMKPVFTETQAERIVVALEKFVGTKETAPQVIEMLRSANGHMTGIETLIRNLTARTNSFESFTRGALKQRPPQVQQVQGQPGTPTPTPEPAHSSARRKPHGERFNDKKNRTHPEAKPLTQNLGEKLKEALTPTPAPAVETPTEQQA